MKVNEKDIKKHYENVITSILVKDLKNQAKRMCLESDYPNKKEILKYLDKQTELQKIQEVAQGLMSWQTNQMYLEAMHKIKQEEKENKPCILQ